MLYVKIVRATTDSWHGAGTFISTLHSALQFEGNIIRLRKEVAIVLFS